MTIEEPFADEQECELCGARRSPYWEVDAAGRVYCSGECMAIDDQQRFEEERKAAKAHADDGGW